jgi:hypothetical protein
MSVGKRKREGGGKEDGRRICSCSVIQLIPADMRLGITFGIAKFGIPDFDSVHFSSSATNLPLLQKYHRYKR